MSFAELHKVLNITRNASVSDLRNAYRVLALQFHPDLNKAQDAPAKFKAITEAYNTLLIEKSKQGTVEKKNTVFTGLIIEQSEFDSRVQNNWHMQFNQFKSVVNSNTSSSSRSLDPLGSNQSDVIIDRVVRAVQSYKLIQGNLKIPTEFTIPYQDYRFPKDVWGLKLGLVVQNIRQHGYLSEYRARLQHIGINVHYNVSEVVLALRDYKAQYGNLLVPRKYIIPHGGSSSSNSNINSVSSNSSSNKGSASKTASAAAAGPVHRGESTNRLAGMPLGKIVHQIRQGDAYSEYSEMFRILGLVVSGCDDDDGEER